MWEQFTFSQLELCAWDGHIRDIRSHWHQKGTELPGSFSWSNPEFLSDISHPAGLEAALFYHSDSQKFEYLQTSKSRLDAPTFLTQDVFRDQTVIIVKTNTAMWFHPQISLMYNKNICLPYNSVPLWI